MANSRERSPRFHNSWFYALGLLAFLGGLAVLPGLFKRTHFLYTASTIEAPVAKPVSLDTSFGTIRISGKPGSLSLKDLLAAHPGGLIVNFWATWCPPCLEELPSLELLHRQLREKNDPRLPWLVTISVDEKPAEVHGLLKTLAFQPSFDILHDPEGTFAEDLGTSRFPETYWIDAQGKVLHKWLGPQDWVSDSVLQRLVSR